MMKCTKCGKLFITLNKYLFHLEYFHGISNYFTCSFDNCKRSFDCKKSFKRHFALKHHVSSSKISNTNNVECILEKSTENSVILDQNKNTDNTEHNEGGTNHNVKTEKESKTCSEIVKDLVLKFHCIFQNSVQLFISKLYDHLSLTRALIQTVIDSVSDFLSSGTIGILQECFGLLCKEVTSSEMEQLGTMFNLLENPFISLKTEYKRFKYFEQCEKLVKPIEICLGVSADQKRTDSEVALQLKNRKAYFVPMGNTLKLFLELPGVFKEIRDHQKFLMNNPTNDTDNNPILSNLVHGSLWKEVVEKSEAQLVLPLVMFFDDMEPLNPLGSHAGSYKLGLLYYTIATIPPAYASRLENLFLALLFYSSDRSYFGNDKTFKILLAELEYLHNQGIWINAEGGQHNVKFVLITISGDNLGLHGILGFHESFSSNNYCRFCTATKDTMISQVNEIEKDIRVERDYDEHVNKAIGLKERCVWNDLPNFHLYNYLSCDIMHDLYEGVHRYDMALIIDNLVNEKFFTLEQLNDRIKYFTYDISEKNIPPGVTKAHLTNRCIIFSAREMLCLVLNFGLIVGDLVPLDNEVWSFYLLLLQMTEILICPTLTTRTLELLTNIIEQHHNLYLKLFNTNLKPKFHFLLHYVRIILKTGPPVHLSCMRFEAKHKDFKSIANSIRCRKNLPYSLALKSQLKQCYRYMSKRGLDGKVNFGTIYESHNVEKEIFENLNLCPQDFFSTTWCEINGCRYVSQCVLFKDYIEDEPTFCVIENIFVNKCIDQEIYIYSTMLSTFGYNSHYRAYRVEKSSISRLFNLNGFCSISSTILHKINDELYVKFDK